ncbi:MAG: polysaccharide deacetylase family protein [Bacteroidales bacterium]
MYIALLIVCLLIFAVYASASISLGIYVKALCKIKINKPIIAITFDDGPNPVYTPKVLEVLRENNIKALFFCVGSMAKKYPNIVKQIIDEGHIIGNHSYSHSNFFPIFSKNKMKADMEQCSCVLEKITGEKTLLFRPPFGVTNPIVASAIKECGFKTVGWSIRSFDTISGPRENVVKRIINKLHNGAIILLHDNRDNSNELLQNLITKTLEKGYKIERLDKIDRLDKIVSTYKDKNIL